jgi:hypothetical protein
MREREISYLIPNDARAKSKKNEQRAITLPSEGEEKEKGRRRTDGLGNCLFWPLLTCFEVVCDRQTSTVTESKKVAATRMNKGE